MVSNNTRLRGVYGYVWNGQLLYVGSSGCSLSTLEYNHRNYKSKYGQQGRTFFRSQITENEDYAKGSFVWLIPPKERTAEEVESLEGQMIRLTRPPFNKDLDPVLSSRAYGRY